VGSDPGKGLNAGLAASLVIGPDGKSQIAYHNYTNANLNFAQQNYRPTLTSINILTGAHENEDLTITYAALAAAADEGDPEGEPVSFYVSALGSGTMTKGGVPVTVGTFLAAGEEFIWTPPESTNGFVVPFWAKAWDGQALSEDPMVAVTVNMTANQTPTLTFIGPLSTASVGAPFTITHADLLAAAVDESDPDGDTISFRIEEVKAGTLTKGGIPVTAGVTVLGPGEEVIWTPDAAGSTEAFTVVAWDGFLASATAVDVTVEVNDWPTLTSVNTLHGATIDTAFTITYATLANAADEADPDGDPIAFQVQAVSSGTLTKGGVAVVPGTTTLGAGEELVWTPPAGVEGVFEAFTVVAHDGLLTSTGDVVVDVDISTALGLVINELKLPAGVVAGSKKAGVLKKVNVVVTNNTAGFISELVTFRLYASSDGTMNTAVQIGTVSKKLKLKPGKAKKMAFKKVVVPALTPGAYRLIVDGALTNPVATVASIAWGTPTFDLTGVLKSTQYRFATLDKAQYHGTVMNLGTADVNTNVRVELYGSADGVFDAGDTLMATYDGVLKVMAGKKRKVPLSFQRFDYGLGDDFNLIMVIDVDDAVAETNELNNEAVNTVVVLPAH